MNLVTLSTGARLGPYEVLSPIGAGGMGEVYRARDTKLNRDVAIKVLPGLFASDPERLARFEREAQALAALNHPNIAQIYGVEESGGITALVMELADGEDLAVRIERGAVPVEDAIPIARAIAEGLEAAHEQGIVHRDLKPANIKIRSDGTVKILDFGLAKALDSSGLPGTAALANSPTFTSPLGRTEMGVILGTAAYMAPEQARGRAVDKRADIWAFGCVLYEMLAGRPAFDGADVTEVLASILKEHPPLEKLPADVPPPVRRLVARCLEKDPLKRLRDIGEARVLLGEIAAGAAEPVAAPAVPARARAAWYRRAVPVVLIVETLALLALAIVFFRPHQSAPAKVVRFDLRVPQNSTLTLATRPAIALSPDGSTIAFVAMTDAVARLYLRRLNDAEARPLPGTDAASDPVFSPDGQSIAFAGGNALKVVTLDGAVTTIGELNDSRGHSWLDDSTIVYSAQPAAGLTRASLGGEPVPLTKLDEGKAERTHRWPSALPGGKALLFTVGTLASPDDYDTSNIEAVKVATGERRVVLKGASMAQYAASGHLLFARGGSLFAIRFDPETLETSGAPVQVVGDLAGDRTTGAAHFSIGADGTLAYIPGSIQAAMRKIVWADPSGKTDALPLPPALYNDLRFSPDGSKVALVSGSSGVADVWIYDFARTAFSRLTFSQSAATPIWSADGRTVYYSEISRDGRTTSIRSQPADGSRDSQEVAKLQTRAYLAQLIPGSFILESFSATTTNSGDILRLATGSSTPVPIVATRAQEYSPAVSPDGRFMAYQSGEQGIYQVYVRQLDTGGRWQVSTKGGEEPKWTPDGNHMYYRLEDTLMIVDVQTGSSFSAGMPRMVMRDIMNLRSDTGISYDVQPKTGRLLMTRQAEETSPAQQLRVVVNWFEELKGKLDAR